MPRRPSLGFGEHRSNDLIDQGRAVRQRIGIFSGNGGAQDIVGRNASALPAKLIATVRTPDTFQDAVTNEGLQDRLKMPWGEPVPGREHRASPCIDGNVNYGNNGEEALARHQRHLGHDPR